MWMNVILRHITCLIVLYCFTISSLEGKKIQQAEVLLKASGKSGVIKPISESKFENKGVLVKKRKKRIRGPKDEQTPSKSRQMINIEDFFSQFNFFNFNNSSSSSDSGSSTTDQTSPTRNLSLTKSMSLGRQEDEADELQADDSMFSLLRIIRLIRRFTNRLGVMRNASLDYDDLSESKDVMTSTSLPSFGSVLGYGTNGSSSPTLLILRAKREVSDEQDINTQHLGFDSANFNLDEIHQESCFMIEEETNKTKDRKNHRYLKLSPCKKENLKGKYCRRKLQLRTKNNIVRKVEICSSRRFKPCRFVSNKYSDEAVSSTNSRGVKVQKNGIIKKYKTYSKVHKSRKTTKRLCEIKLMTQLKVKLLSFIEQYF